MEERELPDVLSCDLAYLTRRIDQIPRVSDFVSHFSQKAYEAVVRVGEDF